ncbi:ArdC family protein [Culturomica massiliensis]|uniref:ArdC family protein n=1 Tax=Culturomica massiliensis TaxID=1841857 RepID=UPI0026661A11|nr:ArdC family protein [Culturomica massiliensis]
MKEKSQFEKNAADKQVELLSEALNGAVSAGGHWLNATGKGYPKFYPAGVSVSPFNALFMALHSDKNGCKSNLFTLYSEAKARGASVREHEKGVPFLFYNWNKYVNKNNPNEVISRNDYQQLSPEEKSQYKGVHNREIRTLFNIDQTLLPHVDKKEYDAALEKYGNSVEQGFGEKELRELRPRFNAFVQSISGNMVPVRTDGSGVAHYDTQKDAIYIPRQKDFAHYTDYAQETLRQIVSATGHQQRLAREGMVMKNGVPPTEDAVKQERLIAEIASGIKMLEMGLPARLSDESIKLVDYWNRELKENPCLIDAIESDVNNALEVIRKAERGEKIEYATYRNHRQTEQMKEQMPKHFFVADEIKKHPDKENKTIVLVIDKQGKSADVILPAGASLEVNNEIKGMSKQRIQSALEKSGIENVRFYNPDGALGYRPDDRYFAEKQIEVARLKNWALEILSTIDAHPAVKQADKPGFEQIQMVQDDKNRWALFIKPEGKAGYSVYPDKDDLNRFFTTLKQSLDNIDKVRGELARKYYTLAESKPDLKVDLFHTADESIDLNRIQRVAVFKTKNGAILCAPIIDNQRLQPRSVTPQQWQRMWIAEDRNSFKQHLAATLFADVLNKSQTQEQTTAEKQELELETKNKQNEEIKSDQPKENVEEEEEVSKGMHR